MLKALLLFVGLQILGDLIVQVAGLLIPGSVMGMSILFIFLIIKNDIPVLLEQGSNEILKYLALIFVPAGVGIVKYLGLLKNEWLIILIAPTVSTLITVLMIIVLYQILRKKA